MDKTINYYNQNANDYSRDTIDVNFTKTQEIFLSMFPIKSLILDFGCGSGRDSLAFIKRGYQVEAIDGSIKLCEIASKLTGIKVKNSLFQDLDEIDKYDGIWACSSILHLKKDELKTVISKMHKALKENGIIYTSFKYGTFEGYRNGRYFIDFKEDSFKRFMSDVHGLKIIKLWLSDDVRVGREDEKWLNIIMQRID